MCNFKPPLLYKFNEILFYNLDLEHQFFATFKTRTKARFILFMFGFRFVFFLRQPCLNLRLIVNPSFHNIWMKFIIAKNFDIQLFKYS